MSAIAEFLARAQQVYKTGIAREHAYRPALHDLLKAMGDDLTPVNDPAKSKVGAPDFIVIRGDIAIGHVEAKDIDVDLRGMKGPNKEQQERYRAALPNLVYTNGLDWDFYRDGQLVASVSVGILIGGIQPRADQFDKLEHLLRDFVSQRPQTITNPKDLAVRMAGKANLIKDVLKNTLRDDAELQTELSTQYQAFKENLIHDITAEDFADIYAETIAYGMFAARLHDDSMGTFSRQEALELLPKSNPFLRSLFTFVAGYDLDERIAWIIDDLARVFQACDVGKLMEGFGRLTGQNDPFLHFYETFLAAYNPAKRKARGVWYTPEPVVNFIVRAVDQVLQTEFGLSEGLADTSKVTIDWETGQTDKKGKRLAIKKDVHRVQILDPATGTGTFLAEVVKQIAPKVQGVAPGMWSQYIEKDLIPRLHGFELLMASYAMCHMKLDMILTELGYKPAKEPPRLSVFLTNSLEEGEPANQTLPFTQWLSREAKGANTIKRDMPIMCVIGNPPYSGISQNMGEWITGMIEDYKYVDGVHFGERKHWLHDDYVKFIRLSESLIEKNGEGVLGFITNHGYLDNPTFRGMRWHLMQTFDKIYVLDLHGSTKKQDVAPDGNSDKNVFDIQQGVAVLVAVKKRGASKKPAEVQHGDLWGSRESKYAALTTATLGSPLTVKIDCQAPHFAFVPRDHSRAAKYGEGFRLDEFMPLNVTGIVTMGDGFAIAKTDDAMRQNLDDLLLRDHQEDEFKAIYGLGKNYAKWVLTNREALRSADLTPTSIAYRPFDTRKTVFDNRILWRWRKNVMRHMLHSENFALVSCRQSAVDSWSNVFIAQNLVDDSYVSNRTKERGYVYPLYLYPDEQDLDTNRRINFDEIFFRRIQNIASDKKNGTPDETVVFDYIYGVLHCLEYRQIYAEFLKSDFPRIPWPTSPEEFWLVAEKGNQLRLLHLMDTTVIGKAPYIFTGDGNNEVDVPNFEDNKVWINDKQYFGNVPETAWELQIGGYQPAQKWLKDRNGIPISFEDVKQYQRILKVLSETDRIMKTIEMNLPD